MNYLLFVYYDNTVKNSEKTTNEIAKQIADQMSSNEAKFMFGEKHAIFHFASEFSIDEMGGWIDIINDELQCFEYFLVPKPRNSVSNMTKENLEHLLTLRKTKPKKNKPTQPKINYDFKEISKEKNPFFLEFVNLAKDFKGKEVCNMTLDELLDKISQDGIGSLSELEKQKLEEYSKSI